MSTSFDSYPADDVKDADAYKTAIDILKPGDAITIFTPDTTVRTASPPFFFFFYCLREFETDSLL